MSPSATMRDPKRPIYFVVHVPKCAGRTIDYHLATNLDPKRYWRTAWRREGFRLLRRRKHDFSYELELAKSLDAISGHRLDQSLSKFFEGRPIRQTVLLRHPTDHLLSYYNFRMNRYEANGDPVPSFDIWYRTRPLNPVSTFLLTYYFRISPVRQQLMTIGQKFEFLSQAFKHFWFVGGHSNCDELLKALCRELSLSNELESKNINVNKRLVIADLSSEIRKSIEIYNFLDLKLFNTWKDVCFSTESVSYQDIELKSRPFSNIGRMAVRPLAYSLIGLRRKISTLIPDPIIQNIRREFR